MHIPEYLLKGTICPVTAAISIAGVATATYFSVKSKEKPGFLKFGIVSALIFGLQMLNFPISGGTSGHFLGTSFAIFTLGIPFGILSISLIVTIQALVFSDGGLTVLGANILNMALVGSLPAIFLYKITKSENNSKRFISIGFSSWLSVILASISCSILMSIVHPMNTAEIFYSMITTHLIIGIGEAFITILAVPIFKISYEKKYNQLTKFIFLSSIFVLLLLLTPFASQLPDGLEWVIEKYKLLKASEPLFVSPLPDYSFPLIQNGYLGTILSGIVGILIITLITYGVNFLLNLAKKEKVKNI